MEMDVEPERRSVTKQAAKWYVRCAEGELTVQERKALQHWLRTAPEHGAELAELSRLDAQLRWSLSMRRRL